MQWAKTINTRYIYKIEIVLKINLYVYTFQTDSIRLMLLAASEYKSVDSKLPFTIFKMLFLFLCYIVSQVDKSVGGGNDI